MPALLVAAVSMVGVPLERIAVFMPPERSRSNAGTTSG